MEELAALRHEVGRLDERMDALEESMRDQGQEFHELQRREESLASDQKPPGEQILDNIDELTRDEVIGRLANIGSEESLLALLDLYCKWNQDEDAEDRRKIVPFLAGAEDPFLALDLLCGAVSCTPDQASRLSSSVGSLFKTKEVRKYAQRLLLDSNEVLVQTFLARSLMYHSGLEPSLSQNDRELIADDLARLYETTTDESLRGYILINSGGLRSPRNTFRLAEAAFHAGPDSHGHSRAWLGIEALRQLVLDENLRRGKGEETANSTQEASRLIVKVALTNSIDLRSFTQAVSALKEMDPGALNQLRGRTSYTAVLETAIESLKAKQ